MSYYPEASHPVPLTKKTNFSTSDEESDTSSGEGCESRMSDIHQYINDEINLEVAIRERLATTVEGRIEWALRMLDALANVKELQDQPLDGDDFHDAALDALEALETPSSFLFSTPPLEERSPSPTVSPIVPSQPTFQRVPKTRSTRTPKPSQQKKHLYIRLPPTTSDSQFAILACPTCGRTQFTTLQGLLNHARLAHGIEWASHDACITACAILISGGAHDREVYERDGVEVPWGGNVVGLRRLFERAVGVDGILPTVTSDTLLESSTTAPSTLLSRTLGLHADSPSLAQFLGRAPKRRCIHVRDEEQDVDIITRDAANLQSDRLTSENPSHPKKGFYMHYPHRNVAREDLDLVVGIDTGTRTADTDSATTHTIIPVGTTTSRFRMTARIRLEDRSLFVKEDRRVQLRINDQYRWMLGVTAPSYSLPLPSFLTCVTVVPPRTVSPMFLIVQQQPFAVVGTASEPFMAKVILEWVGGGKTEVEHWIELDQSKSCTSVFGSEQLLDIELDRNTPLLPAPKECPPLPTLDQRLTYNSSSHISSLQHGCNPTAEEEHYEQILRSLLPRVPMTAKDVKSRMTTQAPYMLVASPVHLLALVPGRRKAIEWARARALRALYVDHMASVLPSRRTVLTVGDVYMFLEDGSHFPRPSNASSKPLIEQKKKGREKDVTPTLGEEFCPNCGIKKAKHPGYDVKTEEEVAQWTCTVVPALDRQYGMRLPLANFTRFLTIPDGLEQARVPPSALASSVRNQALNTLLTPCSCGPRDLVALAPPELVLAVHQIVSKLRLPAFLDLPAYGKYPVYLTGRERTEGSLAPVALLSLALRPFISTLLRSAIEVAKRDATCITPATTNNRGKRTRKLVLVLSPGHVLRGVRLQPSNSNKAISSAPRIMLSSNHWGRESVALCLARVGVRFDAGMDVSARLGTNAVEHLIGHATVKTEPE